MSQIILGAADDDGDYAGDDGDDGDDGDEAPARVGSGSSRSEKWNIRAFFPFQEVQTWRKMLHSFSKSAKWKNGFLGQVIALRELHSYTL